MNSNKIISWLSDGDVSIQYQTWRDLLQTEKPELQKRIESEGWGKQLLDSRGADSHWGKGFYQPKWTSTHYTLLDLKNLAIHPGIPAIHDTVNRVFREQKGTDGGINPAKTIGVSDVCINGMALNYGCYFGVDQEQTKSVVDCLLDQKMGDGGFNCRSNRSGARHSSLHTTLSVLEGIMEYKTNGYTYRLTELLEAEKESLEFILIHRLFRSDRTGEVIRPQFLTFHYPCRWYYDILRAMDYFRAAMVPYDRHMDDALEIILRNKTTEGFWKQRAPHPGEVHFEMEKPGLPGRWNTLRAMRVLNFYRMPV